MARSHRLLASTLAVVGVLATAGCAAGGEVNGGGSDVETIRTTLLTDPSTFDPALSRATDDYTTARLLYDTLLRRDDGNVLVGGLASSWEAIDASNYVFTLRDDATCSDGSPLTPDAVAASLARFMDPETGSSARSLAIGAGTATVTADDAAGTVKVSLSEPWSDLPVGVSLPQSGIVCAPGLADLDGLAAGTVAGATTGPYTLAAAQPAVSYTFALREGYDQWPAFATPLEGRPARTVVLTPIADDATVATQLMAGAIDLAPVFGDAVDRMEGASGFRSVTYTNSTSYLVFNERPGTIFADDRDLRLAVARAIDPSAVNDVVTNGRGEVLHTLASNALACVVDDPAGAISYDADATNTLSGVTIRLIGTTGFGAANDYIAEVLRAQGATVEVNALDNATWSSTTGAGGSEWDMTLQGDVNIMGTLPSSLLRAMGPVTEDGGRSKTGAANDAGYAALLRAMSATDATEKCAALGDAQESILQRVDALPLVSTPGIVFMADGFSIRAFGDYLDVSTMRITK
ncbi:ABC transporter substrate-binding protein [Microbacterium sp. SLBN-111]|uniref:ABC transporter substrate-binding protein n=1 Tax=Microbacterium sp. SLBN-111 TaxID=3377733 RepID=UPI003C746641